MTLSMRPFLLRSILIGIVVPPTMLFGQQRPSDPPLVFDGVTVVDVESGARLSEQRVVVAGTRIAAVGAAGQVELPAGARVVDAKGKYLVPGFWDMHIHPGSWYPVFYPLFLANGVTGVRDAAAAVPLDTLRAWRRGIVAGEHIGPARLILSGQSISEDENCDRSALVQFHMTCVNDAADARHIVDSLKAAGADMVKPYDITTPEVYYALASEARRLGVLFGGHLVAVTAEEAADSGASLLDHINSSGGLDASCVSSSDATESSDGTEPISLEACRPVAERMIRHNTWHVPTVSIFAALGVASRRTAAILARATEYLTAFWADTASLNTATAGTFSNWLKGPVNQDTVNLPPPSEVGHLRVAQQLSLPIVVGTDAAGGGATMRALGPGWGAHEEMAMLVAEGLTPLAALQAGTVNPAKALRMTDSLGTIARGKLADLVLLDADPLVDITNTTAIQAVVANGRYFDRAALDKVLIDVRNDEMTRRVIR